MPTIAGFEPRPSRTVGGYSNHSTKALTLLLKTYSIAKFEPTTYSCKSFALATRPESYRSKMYKNGDKLFIRLKALCVVSHRT